ncbi:BnaCnng63820D [Brassica napus]|uniref:BnaCnng63820D protein n=1 Tax=Brassica napus TaxID=3708 RepID=A0A078JRN8_BRANA|nr:BnaCnng63820D [Brassica napus]
MLSDDSRAKRAATEEESDSSVSKKPKIEDEDDTCMEDEDDSDSNNPFLWSTDEENDDSPTINYLNLQDQEPEWDKDSYDGYELEFDPDGREGFPDDKAYQDFRDYKTKAFKNRGFFEDPFRSIYPIIDLEDLWSDTTNVTRRQYLANIASLCVKKLNEQNRSSVEVVSIVRGNLKPGGGYKLYITFMAREYPDGPLVEYQAKAMDFAGGRKPPFPILCRPASSIS